jgi:hypothetical protein
MITIPAKPHLPFCPKHGTLIEHGPFENTEGVCAECGLTLNQCVPAYVKYICETCGEIYEAEIDWLEENKFTCISCKGMLVNKCGYGERSVFHVRIDGSWDGVPVGKKIQEKNNQLKEKHAGYSYEQASLQEKVGELVQKRQREGW